MYEGTADGAARRPMGAADCQGYITLRKHTKIHTDLPNYTYVHTSPQLTQRAATREAIFGFEDEGRVGSWMGRLESVSRVLGGGGAGTMESRRCCGRAAISRYNRCCRARCRRKPVLQSMVELEYTMLQSTVELVYTMRARCTVLFIDGSTHHGYVVTPSTATDRE